MKARMSLIAAALGGVMMGQQAMGTIGWPELAARVYLDYVEARAQAPASSPGDGLRDPSSFIVVHNAPSEAIETPTAPESGVRISIPRLPGSIHAAGATGTSSGRLIPVPANARAGDPAYAEVEVADDEQWLDDGGAVVYGPHGMIFAEGVELGYTTLKRHQPRHRRHRGSDVQRDRDDVPEFGADDLHRSAQLKFAEAAQPRLDGLDDAFRRAQLEFHRSTLAPGVRRGADGLRHERAPAQARPRGRMRW